MPRDRSQGCIDLLMELGMPLRFCRVVKTAIEPIRQYAAASVAVWSPGGAIANDRGC